MDTLTGAVIDKKLEFRLIGPLELRWHRIYDSSQHTRRFAFGWGHTHELDRSLRFDADGISYLAPLGKAFGFPPLLRDGEQSARHGYTLRRISVWQYVLSESGEPSMEFIFSAGAQTARLHRLFRGKDQIRFYYDPSGRWERIVDSAGRTIRVAEEADGRLVSLIWEKEPGQTAQLLIAYRYDERGNLVATTHGSGAGHKFSYDEANRLVRAIGRMGFTFQYVYDAQGRCTKSWGDDRLSEVSLEYQIRRRVTKVTRADGGVWTYFFDEAGELIQVLDPLGGVRKFLRDEAGRLTAETDLNGRATRFVYDGAGKAVAKISPLGHRIGLPANPNAADPLAHRVAANPAEYEYGRLIDLNRIVLPAADEIAGLPVSFDERPRVAVRRHDEPTANGAGPRIEVRPLGARWWPEPRRGWVFNDLGKLVRQQDDQGHAREWSYDLSGNLAGYRDFDGREWKYDYGTWHLRRAETNPVGSTIRFTYTPTEHVASCTDARGTRSDYLYDLNDHLVEVRRHGVTRDFYQRDPAGNLLAKRAADGRTLLTFEVGPAGLPAKRTLASGDEHTFKYDAFGRYLAAATKKDLVELSYDEIGNRCVEKRNGLGVEHRFHGWGCPVESVFFGRFIVRYERRSDGILRITDPAGARHEIRLHAHGLTERRFSNGSSETAQYDGLGRCWFKSAKRVAGPVWSRRYHWSGEGELRKIEESNYGEIRCEFDVAHRLRSRTLPGGWVEKYEFDEADNLVALPGVCGLEHRDGNRLLAIDGYRVEYNDRNHLASRQTPTGTVTYTYDSRDQLIEVDSVAGTWAAQYDALGRRTRKTHGSGTTEFYWNTDQLIAEISPDGRFRLYVYSDPLALTPLLFLDYESTEASPGSGRRFFVFTDQIGTPCLVENENGAEVWRARIVPFGSAEPAPHAELEFNLRFPGHYLDQELGLHYNRFRYYDPRVGRFLQCDPWGVAGGVNLYTYYSNPMLKVDVRGLGDEAGGKGSGECEDGHDAESPPPRQEPGPDGRKYADRAADMSDGSRERDQRYGVTIFGPEEREGFRVVADSEGRLINAQSGERVDTGDHPAIYVMDQDGNVYLHPDPKFGEIHHSSIAGGEPVAAAGEMQVIDGQVVDINDHSGHYGGNLQPGSPDATKQELGSQGVDVSQTQTAEHQK